MTKFELKDDYRTASYEAIDMLGLNQEDIYSATSYHELYGHLTPAKQQLALAAVEVYKLYSYRERKQSIRTSQDLYELMKPLLQDVSVEEGWLILLNGANSVVRRIRISVGGIDSTVVDVRVVLKEAILASATSIVLVHNHPSGNRRPSVSDDRLTEQVNKAARVMNIKLMDHLIFAGDGFYSYCDEGRI